MTLFLNFLKFLLLWDENDNRVCFTQSCVIIVTDLIRKVFQYLDTVIVKFMMIEFRFPQIPIFAWKLKRCHLQNAWPVVFLDMTCSFCSFTLVCCQLFFQGKNGISWKNQLAQFSTQVITDVIFFKTSMNYTFTWCRMLHAYFPFVTQDIKKSH